MKYLKKINLYYLKTKLEFPFIVFLYIIWFALSWQVNFLFFTFGLISVTFSVFIVNLLFENLSLKFKLLQTLSYIFWLILQIVLSSIYVIRKICTINGKLNQSKIIVIEDKYNDDLLSTIFANSVTLTPGSATILIKNHKIFIHLLNSELEHGVYDIYNKVKEKFG